MNHKHDHRRLFAALLAMGVLSGCGSSADDELREWMATQRSQAKSSVTPIPPPKPYQAQDYLQGAALEPTLNVRLVQALQRDNSQRLGGANLITAEMARSKDPLEAYPLESMSMVGSLQKAGERWALIKVDNLLYQVRPGQYLGVNYGRVTRVTEREVNLREIIQDAAGEWIERPTTLQLQENKQ